MTLLSLLSESSQRGSHLLHGVVVGLVTNNQDPDNLGRVKVQFPWLSHENESAWARIVTPMAGNNRGLYCLPEVDDEVLVMFEQGDPSYPFVLGALWNAKDKPPGNNSDGKNNVRLIQSRSGHQIRLNDEDGNETIEIIDKTGKNKLVIDTSNNSIAITSDKDIMLSAPKGTIKLEAKTIELKSSTSTKLEAGAGLELKSNATMNLKGAIINLN